MSWAVQTIPLEGLNLLWPTVTPMLSEAVPYSGGRLDMRSVHQKLVDRTYLLWVVAEDNAVWASMVTRVAAYPKRALLSVDLLGGAGLSLWADAVTRRLQAFAFDSHLDGVEFYGRAPWARALRKYGWKSDLVLCEIEAKRQE